RCCESSADCQGANPCMIYECDTRLGQCKTPVPKTIGTSCEDGSRPSCISRTCVASGLSSPSDPVVCCSKVPSTSVPQCPAANFDNSYCENIAHEQDVSPADTCLNGVCNPNFTDPKNVDGCQISGTGAPGCCTTDADCPQPTGPNTGCAINV